MLAPHCPYIPTQYACNKSGKQTQYDNIIKESMKIKKENTGFETNMKI